MPPRCGGGTWTATLDPTNPFLAAEALWGEMVETAWNAIRDSREAAIELCFLSIYLTPMAMQFGEKRRLERTRKDPKSLALLPEVQVMVNRAAEGGLAEAILRMLILVAGTRGDTRADRLARSMETMHQRPLPSQMSVDERVRSIHAQTVIAHFAPEAALAATLPARCAAVRSGSRRCRRCAMWSARKTRWPRPPVT